MAFRVAVLCVAAAVLCLFLKSSRPEIALSVALAAGVIACILSLDELREIVDTVKRALYMARVENEDALLIIKVSGIAIAGEYGAQLCRDAGEGALAQRVDMAVRFTMMALTAPVIMRVLDTIMGLGA